MKAKKQKLTMKVFALQNITIYKKLREFRRAVKGNKDIFHRLSCHPGFTLAGSDLATCNGISWDARPRQGLGGRMCRHDRGVQAGLQGVPACGGASQ